MLKEYKPAAPSWEETGCSSLVRGEGWRLGPLVGWLIVVRWSGRMGFGVKGSEPEVVLVGYEVERLLLVVYGRVVVLVVVGELGLGGCCCW